MHPMAGLAPAIMLSKAIMDNAPRIFAVDRLELAFEPKSWPFAVERRTEIDSFFTKLQRDKPAIWNGRVLLMHRHVLAERVLRGAFLETDYASFAAWGHWRSPPAGVHDCFSAAAIFAADGGFLLGVMGQHTYNAGQIYFPCGTPDPSDVIDNKVDLDFSARRELEEETGLTAEDVTAEPGWTMIVDGSLVALVKVFRSPQGADALRGRILRKLSQQKNPELADIHIARGPADLVPTMRGYAAAFLQNRWGGA
jgi:8-oxo-dGTP pyrophosphatase MutT (NUDIX family)